MIDIEETVALKSAVKAHWQRQPCGTRDLLAADRREFFRQLEQERYALEPYLPPFARFAEGRAKQVLEIGVGAGTDFVNWVRNGALAVGIDLTEQGVQLTQERLRLEGLQAEVRVADAEHLPFTDNSFDLVYSYGVLHHSPDTEQAVREIRRVLKPGGQARVMIYHANCWVGYMLWGVHCLAKLKPWKSPRWAIYHHLESPGTKAYTLAEAHDLFAAFTHVNARTQLTHGDLLLMRPDKRYQKWRHKLAWQLYPRSLVKTLGNRWGMALFIEATK
jgi:SAM-dependent methyltransferase